MSNLLFRLINPRTSSEVTSDDEEEQSSYESLLARLQQHHTLPEFKLRCWARMLVWKFKFPARQTFSVRGMRVSDKSKTYFTFCLNFY